jgi:NADH-quinone oxidoreductase subunit L
MTDYLWVIVALPLAGFLINLAFGKRIGEPLAGWLGFSLIGVSWLIALFPTLDFLFGRANPETIFHF